MSAQGRNGRVLLNFCLVCGIWGSTFLAVKYAIDGIPPFVVTAGRYLTASVVLFGISRWKRESRLGARNLGVAAISGFLLSLANALVCYSETALPSGLVAVVIGSLPAWIILLDWQLFRGKAPLWGQVGGICLSLVGVAALTGGQSHHFDSRNLLIWVALISSIGIWAMGTLIQRSASLGGSIFQFSAVQSMTGGLLIGMTAAGSQGLSFDWGQIPLLAIFAVIYLALAGTVVASTSYVWLSQNADPRLISTYALITPVVAVWLGWLLAGEEVTISTLGNSLIVLAGVALILLSGRFSCKFRRVVKTAPQVSPHRPTVVETVRPLAEVVSGS